jgi:hypothetical protein
MATTSRTTFQQAREALVRRHSAAEEVHDIEATVGTFYAPRYEVAPFGVGDGADAVRSLLNTMVTGFPDWHINSGDLRRG